MSILGDTEGIKRQRKNLAKFDARVREGIRQLLNVATLGFGLKGKDLLEIYLAICSDQGNGQEDARGWWWYPW